MRHESLPDIPQPGHPEHRPIQEAAEISVAERVAGLEIGLDLDKHENLRSRLAETGAHFEDSLAMAGIIRTTFGQLKEKLNLSDEGPERLMRAAILHDIGKSGPAGIETPFHDAVRKLFAPPKRPFSPYLDGRTKTIAEFAAEQDLDGRTAVLAELKAAGIDPDKEPMIEFWRRHAQWTYDILRSEDGPDLDPDLIKIAASHHLLENQNPANLDLKDVPAEAHVLEVLEETELLAVVDKYQAFRSRGRLKHEDALVRLGEIMKTRLDLPAILRDRFNDVIQVLSGAKDVLERHFRGDEGDDMSARA